MFALIVDGFEPVWSTGARFLICEHCGDRIGVYEPTVVEAAGQVRQTSTAAEPELSNANGLLYHRGCHAERASRQSV
jgi:hypothetical protein